MFLVRICFTDAKIWALGTVKELVGEITYSYGLIINLTEIECFTSFRYIVLDEFPTGLTHVLEKTQNVIDRRSLFGDWS